METHTVTAESLHRIQAQAGDWQMEDASIFPFFDVTGAVSWLMFVAPESADIFFLKSAPGETNTLGQGVALAAHYQRWEDLDAAVQGEIGALLHYDPWWVLAEERFHGHEAVPVLKATNVVDSFTNSPPVYTPDLVRVEGDARGVLSTRAASAPSRDTTEWTFDPIWTDQE